MQYYSQFGQDQFLYENYFQGKTDGVFVDIGAHDGISGSNTYLFEQLGWRGICFEPAPDIFERLKQNRKCSLRQVAISDKAGSFPFRFIKGYSEMLSGLLEYYSKEHLSRISREIQEHNQEDEIINVMTATFSNMVAYRHIDILSIDTEGSEERIIRTIPFEVYDINFMIVEFNTGVSPYLHDYIESKGFRYLRQMGCDRIYNKA